MERPAIVIFGAAVRPDGRPSPSLLRRIGYGLKAAHAHPEATLGVAAVLFMFSTALHSGVLEARLRDLVTETPF